MLKKECQTYPKNIMPIWILNNFALNVNPVHRDYHFQKMCGRYLHKSKDGNVFKFHTLNPNLQIVQ